MRRRADPIAARATLPVAAMAPGPSGPADD